MVANSDSITERMPSPSKDFRAAQPSQLPIAEATTKSTASDVLSSVDSNGPSVMAVSRSGLMKQSTIYRRHEARLARSYALRDDPRPAFLRVLSGLPGFRIIIPPYQKERNQEAGKQDPKNQQKETHAPRTVIDTYSQENSFAPYTNVADNAVGSTFGDANTNDNIRAVKWEETMQAMLATGVCSAIGEYVFAHHSNISTAKRAVRNSNTLGPMMMTTTTAAPQTPHSMPYTGGFGALRGGSLDMPRETNKNHRALAATKSRPSNVALSKAMSASFSTSLLFGTKVFLDATISERQFGNDANRSNSTTVMGSLVSSATAGGVIGLSQLASLQIKHRRDPSSFSVAQNHYLTSDGSSKLIGRNVLASLLYFSIYEAVSFFASTQTSTSIHPRDSISLSNGKAGGEKGTLSIVMGGAFAGVAQAGTMNYHRYARYGSTIWWTRVMFPAASLSAPIHALVFYGYEKMKEGIKTAHR